MPRKNFDSHTLPLDPDNDPRLEKGYHFNNEGKIEDKNGNIFDEAYNLVKEAPSEGLLLARKQHPDKTDQQLSSLAKIYNNQINAKTGKNKL